MNNKRYSLSSHNKVLSKQRGATLFFALIGLVVLMLTAAALVRSVDTASIISGNLSFRQGATSAGDRGVEAAMSWLNTKMGSTASASASSVTDAIAATNTTDTSFGYYASNEEFLSGSITDPKQDAAWASGRCRNIGEDDRGNSVCYVIERMCLKPASGEVIDLNTMNKYCILADLNALHSSVTGKEQPIAPELAFMFRVTARVRGPRNTVSYIQSFVY